MFHSEDDWKSLARNKLKIFEEELHSAHEAGLRSYSGLKAWTFINGVVYCMSVVTTIGEFLCIYNLETKIFDSNQSLYIWKQFHSF